MVQIAVIGLGHWGKNVVRVVHELGHLSAVSDQNLAVANNFASQYKVPAHSLEDILTNPAIDAIMLATPAACHAKQIEAALQAGKHVFVEKPLALSVAEGEHLVQLAAFCRRILMVGHLMRYHPAFEALEALIDEGKLGKLQYIYSTRLNLGKFRSEENILWSFAPHDLSMILALAGAEPESVFAVGNSYLHPNIADVTTTQLQFAHGLSAHVFVSWLHPYKEQKLVVVGDRGMAILDDGLPWDTKLQLFSNHIDWIKQHPVPQQQNGIKIPLTPKEPLRVELQHFIEAISQGTPPRTDGKEGLRVLKVLDASERAMRSRKWVSCSMTPLYFAHETAIVDAKANIGEGSKIWHFSHVMAGATLGKKVILGQNTFVASGVTVGDFCKIQNNVSLYSGVILEEGVFCGPSCVFTNVMNPRAEIERKAEYRKTHVGKSTTIGANATIVCGVTLGAYSFVGAGSVVTKDVLPHAVVVGNPAKQIGWVSHAGERLDDNLVCPREGRRYTVTEGKLVEVTKENEVTAV